MTYKDGFETLIEDNKFHIEFEAERFFDDMLGLHVTKVEKYTLHLIQDDLESLLIDSPSRQLEYKVLGKIENYLNELEEGGPDNE